MHIRTVGVAGLGIQGRDIAACLLGYGFQVVAFTRRRQTHDSARGYIGREVEELVRRLQFDPRLAENWSDRYAAVDVFDQFAPCDFVIETIVEDAAAKRQVFGRIEAVVGRQTTIATNTSAIPISLLQQDCKHPERFVGMHWGEPAHISRFMELIRGRQTSREAFDAALQLGRALGKEPSLVQQDVAGFVGNRIGFAIYREALHILESGVADVETIDRSFRNAAAFWATLGGPFREMDLTGGPSVYAPAMQRLFPQLCNAAEIPQSLQKLAESNAQGIANGRGFYNYTPEEAKRWEELFRENAWKVRALLDAHFPLEKPCS